MWVPAGRVRRAPTHPLSATVTTTATAANARPSLRRALGAVVPSGWAGVVIRRLLLLPLTLLFVATLTFVITRVVGGNPAVKLAGAQPSIEAIRNIEHQLGLDVSIGAQYVHYLGGLAHGDLGRSYFTHQDVVSEILNRAPGTIELVVLGALIAALIGIGLGMAAARRARRPFDQAAQGLSILAFATPDFFLGAVLAFFLFFKFGWFPAPAGQLPFSYAPPTPHTHFLIIDTAVNGQWDAFGAHLQQLALPALTLGLIYFAPIFKITRASLLEILRSDFLLYAEACGLRRSIERRYAFRHAMMLVSTYVGIITAALIGGAVLVEQVYSWGGLGTYGVGAIQNNDFPAVQGFVVAVGTISVVVYFAVDILYAVIDPRVRLG